MIFIGYKNIMVLFKKYIFSKPISRKYNNLKVKSVTYIL